MRAALRAFGLGALAGLGWGVVVRGSMRLLAEYPDFTWSGTLAIVGSASVVGGLVALVRSARRSGRSRWWRLLGLPFVLLFGAAGILLLPGVVGIVMLLDRRAWPRVPGIALLGLTLWAVFAELDGSPMPRQWVGVTVMLACLAVEGWAAHELVRRWRPEDSSRSPVAATTGDEPSPEPVAAKAVGEVGRSRSSAP